jgi:hypothetical protein
MNKIILISTLILFGFSDFSQNLDRISISSGGSATDVVNYVIGETFNFSMASGGNITVETGTLGSTENSGGLQNTVSIEQVAVIKKIACYPNPTTDAIYFAINDKNQNALIVNVFDLSGKLLLSSKTENMCIMKLDLQSITQGSYIAAVSNSKGEVLGSFQFIKQ